MAQTFYKLSIKSTAIVILGVHLNRTMKKVSNFLLFMNFIYKNYDIILRIFSCQYYLIGVTNL